MTGTGWFPPPSRVPLFCIRDGAGNVGVLRERKHPSQTATRYIYDAPSVIKICLLTAYCWRQVIMQCFKLAALKRKLQLFFRNHSYFHFIVTGPREVHSSLTTAPPLMSWILLETIIFRVPTHTHTCTRTHAFRLKWLPDTTRSS